jgi:hypothetical protein
MFFNNSKLLKEAKVEIERLEAENSELNRKYSTLINLDREIEIRNDEIKNLKNQIEGLNTKYSSAYKIYEDLKKQTDIYSDTVEVSSYGLYQRQFDFDTSERFKDAIEVNYIKQKTLIKEDKALISKIELTYNNSASEGKKMVNRYKKLMLFALNGECDSIISKLKWNNATKALERIHKTVSEINKLGEIMQISVAQEFIDLKTEELKLNHEYLEKKYEEKEEQRRIKEQMREEEKAQKELEREQKEAEEEEIRFQKALEKAKKDIGNANESELEDLNIKINELEKQLEKAHERKERAVSMAQLTKVGHIYIISNIGSFGENIVKIGMTRRLDPEDRVKELGDASVPFHFDIHAIIFSENAPQLENEFHKHFHERRINKINNKKEFFNVTLEEIEIFIKNQMNSEIKFTKTAEAREFRETIQLRNSDMTLKNPNDINLPKSLF